MTPDVIDERLRGHLDALAPPITIDELAGSDPVALHPARRRRAVVAAVGAAAVLLVAVGLVAARVADGDGRVDVEPPATEPTTPEGPRPTSILEPGIYREALPLDEPFVRAVIDVLPEGAEARAAGHIWSSARRIDHHMVAARVGEDHYDVTVYEAFTPAGLASLGERPHSRQGDGTMWVTVDEPDQDVVVHLSDSGVGLRIALVGPSARDGSAADLAAIAVALPEEQAVRDLEGPGDEDLAQADRYGQDLAACMADRGLPIDLVEQSPGAYDIDGGEAEGTSAYQSALAACTAEADEREEARRHGPGGAPEEPTVEAIPFDGQDDADRMETCLVGLGFVVELTFEAGDDSEGGVSIATDDGVVHPPAAFDAALEGCSAVGQGLGGPPG